MSEILIGIGLVIFLGGLSYFLARKQNRQLENVGEGVYRKQRQGDLK